ncbi:restriction endonuclease subunit S [Shewanella sp. 4t3-1-2LB]|uniref:restriction endonuclease subunit S n=1 Tax=Shewanella sp. 4t3-1-2LB TaxID=2817682 RepID=UPI001A99A638|nr:restriction endonuclease subunit S [Shewanella sp. 4t3-1-2LB]MBO1271952.1 restriction endonuclease subunit S [Shewanella sp. 4t3-1-2LB]
MSDRAPEGWNKAPLNKYVTRIRTPLDGKPENVLTISSTAGWVDQREKWARNMAGESLKKYTCLTRGELSYNRGNSKTFPYGCVFKLNRWSSAAVPNVYHSFRVIDGKADPDFVQYAFHGGTLDYQLRQIITSSARANGLLNITAADFFEIELVAPPLPEQRKIAKILTSVDEVIEKTQAQIDKLKDLKTGMMQELLTKGVGVDGKPHTEFKDSPVGRIPKTWKVAKLESVAVIQTGAAKSSKLEGDLIELPYLRVANVQDGYLDLKEIKTIKIPKSKSERFLLRENDVLVNEGGDFDKLGRGSIWFGQISPCAHQNHVFAVRTNINKLSPSFFNHLSGAEYGKKYYLGCAKQTTNLASINSTQLKQFPVLLPSIEEQGRICAMLDSVDLRISKQESKLRHLESLKKALMQDLLTGKVRVAID